MKVKDYVKDMTLGQKWIIVCSTYLTHDSSPSFEDVAISRNYYSVPFSGRCRYLNYEVDFFRVYDNSIVLYVHDSDFV